jgi:hypothetical protein
MPTPGSFLFVPAPKAMFRAHLGSSASTNRGRTGGRSDTRHRGGVAGRDKCRPSVERGLADREGRPYPIDLAALANYERARSRRRRADVEGLDRRLDFRDALGNHDAGNGRPGGTT